MMAMAQAGGKGGAMTIPYYDLCGCYEAEMRHPPRGITGRDLVTAAENGCLTCSIVKDALTTVLKEPINEGYNIVYKLVPEYGIKIRYMLENEWSTQRKFQVLVNEGWLRPLFSAFMR